MLPSIVIIICSMGLLVYWFRYTCILLVRNSAEELRSSSAAAAQSSFSFAEIQVRLEGDGTTQLDPLHSALQRDYQVLSYLLEHASGLALESFEERLLVWDYKLMQVWYSFTRIVAPHQA